MSDTPKPALPDATIEEHTAAIHRLTRRSGQDIIEIGHRLIAVKAKTSHGAFGPWLESEFGWTARTAQNFMRVAESFGDMRNGFAFEAKALYALASGDVPEEVREQFITRAEAGEPVRYRDVRDALTPPEARAERAEGANSEIFGISRLFQFGTIANTTNVCFGIFAMSHRSGNVRAMTARSNPTSEEASSFTDLSERRLSGKSRSLSAPDGAKRSHWPFSGKRL